MTDQQKLDILARLIEDEEEETATLDAYLSIAGDKILNRMYPFETDYTGLTVPDRYAMIQINIAVYLMNKRGAEGQIQHIENGTHRNYGSSDVPSEMLRDIVPMAKAIR